MSSLLSPMKPSERVQWAVQIIKARCDFVGLSASEQAMLLPTIELEILRCTVDIALDKKEKQ